MNDYMCYAFADGHVSARQCFPPEDLEDIKAVAVYQSRFLGKETELRFGIAFTPTVSWLLGADGLNDLMRSRDVRFIIYELSEAYGKVVTGGRVTVGSADERVITGCIEEGYWGEGLLKVLDDRVRFDPIAFLSAEVPA